MTSIEEILTFSGDQKSKQAVPQPAKKSIYQQELEMLKSRYMSKVIEVPSKEKLEPTLAIPELTALDPDLVLEKEKKERKSRRRIR